MALSSVSSAGLRELPSGSAPAARVSMSSVGATRLYAQRRPGSHSSAVVREPAPRRDPPVLEEAPESDDESVESHAARMVRVDAAEWEREYRLVLAELDFLHRALRASRSADAEPATPIARPIETAVEPRDVAAPPPPPPIAEVYGAPSPYLEDRLATAQAVASELSGEFARMEQRSTELRASVRTLEDELTRASDELVFLRERDEREFEQAPSNSVDPGAARRANGSPAPAPRPPAYQEFTAARYNETIRGAVDRRRTIAVVTVVLAALISGALLVLTYFAHEPMPTPWLLAGLPVVWLVPVPFFVTSFRGSQRVLGKHALDVPEVP
jgi:hypothetical protein